MKLLGRLEKKYESWFIIGILLLFFLLRMPSLFEPNWYGDEGIYQVLGSGMSHGRLLYRDIWDNKPPLLYTTYSLLSSDQFNVRAFSLIVGLLSVAAFFFLAKKIIPGHIPIILTTLFAILFAMPLLEGNIANSENFMMLPILVAGLMVTSLKNQNNSRSYAIIGGLLSIAFLFKVVGIFDFAAFTTFLFITTYKTKKYLFSQTASFLPLILAFSTPIIGTALFFLLNNAFSDFINATLAQNVGYVGYGNTFIFPHSLLILKLIILGTVVCLLFWKRKHMDHETLFIFLWFSFSLFNALFSQRPYTHYLLVLLPAFLLLIGLAMRKKDITIGAVILGTIFLIKTNFNMYHKTFSYYQNFMSYVRNEKSISMYQDFFDKNTPKDYAIAQFLKNHMDQKDQLFIWGNDAQVYILTHKLPPGKFTVAYHMNATSETLKETFDALKKTKPKYIVVSSSHNPLPFFLNDYKTRFVISDALIYEHIF